MSRLPVFAAPGLMPFQFPVNDDNITYKWIDDLGGSILPKPLVYGDLRPDGKPAKVGIATVGGNGHTTVEYHYY
ncbi:hypothetical protein QJ856_gp0370 [Tupanvirus deep ocean]|uniref:Uncharacterized protein n=2 Tax=Tupanvirus TaxID=2094720 RepID=A0AC62A9L6_9VIRU|nr:hypothetical protein QJ856_gp0370 [Tupanvirus deep ocean]QKU34368.1 hypothetical protein [Tupanvirus deep ocean]